MQVWIPVCMNIQFTQSITGGTVLTDSLGIFWEGWNASSEQDRMGIWTGVSCAPQQWGYQEKFWVCFGQRRGQWCRVPLVFVDSLTGYSKAIQNQNIEGGMSIPLDLSGWLTVLEVRSQAPLQLRQNLIFKGISNGFRHLYLVVEPQTLKSKKKLNDF